MNRIKSFIPRELSPALQRLVDETIQEKHKEKHTMQGESTFLDERMHEHRIKLFQCSGMAELFRMNYELISLYNLIKLGVCDF